MCSLYTHFYYCYTKKPSQQKHLKCEAKTLNFVFQLIPLVSLQELLTEPHATCLFSQHPHIKINKGEGALSYNFFLY